MRLPRATATQTQAQMSKPEPAHQPTQRCGADTSVDASGIPERLHLLQPNLNSAAGGGSWSRGEEDPGSIPAAGMGMVRGAGAVGCQCQENNGAAVTSCALGVLQDILPL